MRLRRVEELAYAIVSLTALGFAFATALHSRVPTGMVLTVVLGATLAAGAGIAALLYVRITGRYLLEALWRLIERMEEQRRHAPYQLWRIRLSNPYAFVASLLVIAEAAVLIAAAILGRLGIESGVLPGAGALATGVWLLGRSLYHPVVKVGRKKPPWYVVARSTFPVFDGLAEKLDSRLRVSGDLRLSGAGYTRKEAIYLLSSGMLLAFIAVLASIPLAILVSPVLLAAAAPLPLLVVLAIKAYAKAKLGERARLAGEEHPYVAFWMWLMVSGGGAEPEAALIEAARRRDLFPGTWLDGIYARRGIGFVAEMQPSKMLRDFYRFVDAVKSSGGDVSAYLADAVWRAMENLRVMLTEYAERANTVMTLVAAFLGLGVLSALAIALINLGAMLALLSALTAGLPLLAAVFYIVLASIQPRLRERYRDAAGIAVAAIAASIPPLLALTGLLRSDAGVVYASLALAAGSYGAMWWSQYMVKRGEEDRLADALRIIVEYVKMGYPVPRAMELAAEQIGGVLALRLRSAARGRVEAQSWLLRYVLETMQLMSRYGAASPEALERLVKLVEMHVAAWKETRARLMLARLLALIVPVSTVATLKIVAPMAQRYLSTAVAAAGPLRPPPGALESFNIAVQWSMALVGLAGLLMGLLAAKATDLTIRNTLYALLAVLLAALVAIVPLPLPLG
ncbi:hypothetical protein [Pyrodictium delaneyi]|uniref:Type II secretion system protein GspF domain-containing protein n=1 Tax=Pyrodictium delaneyi TaxID=1273541 RepID=A0A211YRP2_9CREN|nr:hypothetical protein [Pyrodictium delaneyi]OWJ55584.1 hypothetical protein Pdsh_02010 [Pyrodictium delaneyi]